MKNSTDVRSEALGREIAEKEYKNTGKWPVDFVPGPRTAIELFAEADLIDNPPVSISLPKLPKIPQISISTPKESDNTLKELKELADALQDGYTLDPDEEDYEEEEEDYEYDGETYDHALCPYCSLVWPIDPARQGDFFHCTSCANTVKVGRWCGSRSAREVNASIATSLMGFFLEIMNPICPNCRTSNCRRHRYLKSEMIGRRYYIWQCQNCWATFEL